MRIANMIEEMTHASRQKALNELLRIIDHGDPGRGDVPKLNDAMRMLDLSVHDVELILERRADYKRAIASRDQASAALASRSEADAKAAKLEAEIVNLEHRLVDAKAQRAGILNEHTDLQRQCSRAVERIASITANHPLAVGLLPGSPEVDTPPPGPIVKGSIPANLTPPTPLLRRTLVGAGFSLEQVKAFVGDGLVLVAGRPLPDGTFAGPVVVEDQAVPA
jgi:hypothetical protein